MTGYFNRLLDLEYQYALQSTQSGVPGILPGKSAQRQHFVKLTPLIDWNSNFDNWMTCYFNRLLDLEYQYALQSTQSGVPGILPGKSAQRQHFVQLTPLIDWNSKFDNWMTCYFNRLLDLEYRYALQSTQSGVPGILPGKSTQGQLFLQLTQLIDWNSNFDNWMTCYFNRLLDLEYRYALQSTQSGVPSILPGKSAQ